MVSKMAIGDIEALKDDGIELTPEEIVRLNAFGLKVERNFDSSEYFVLPRVALIGDVVLHEPTIGSEIWIEQVGKVFDMEDPYTFIQLRAFSLAVPSKELPNPYDKELVRETTTNFFKERLGDFTVNQINNALEYAILGNNERDFEQKAKIAKEKEKADDKSDEFCYEAGLLRQGIVYGIGNADEIRDMTVSEVRLYVEFELHKRFGSEKVKSEHSSKLGEYFAVLDEIRENHKKNEVEEK